MPHRIKLKRETFRQVLKLIDKGKQIPPKDNKKEVMNGLIRVVIAAVVRSWTLTIFRHSSWLVMMNHFGWGKLQNVDLHFHIVRLRFRFAWLPICRSICFISSWCGIFGVKHMAFCLNIILEIVSVGRCNTVQQPSSYPKNLYTGFPCWFDRF